MPNGSALDRPLPQVLEAQQHGQHPFELAVEMDLKSTEPFQLTGVQRLLHLKRGHLPEGPPRVAAAAGHFRAAIIVVPEPTKGS